ncbi:hypothetical protein QTP86_028478 [Hemibagrus guttatus]|nr:hypothetical protein QTP86_028478 [Hemibagrus guttatus]
MLIEPLFHNFRQVPAILKNIGAVVLHADTNDIRLRQTEILKKDFRSLVELVRHIAHDKDHRVRTTSHVPERNREVQ